MKLTTVLPLLVVALSQMARGALFTSATTGVWSNPATWVGGVGFPDTYAAADSATINSTHTVSYDGSINLFLGGNLLVAAGNQITVNGGTLNQTWVPGAAPPFGTAIGIGVSHPLSGIGKMVINAGGLFDSGTANVVVVGITNPALGGAVGNGTLNVNDGTLLVNAAAGAGGPGALGLAVGIDAGATGTMIVGDGIGAAGTAKADLATNNALLTIGGETSTGVGGTGTLSIGKDGLLTSGTLAINVGEDTGNGSLNIDGSLTGGSGGVNVGRANSVGFLGANVGSAFTTTGEFNIGSGTAAIGNADINGGTTSVGETSVGRGTGSGDLDVAGGSSTVNGKLFVGRDPGSIGSVSITNGTVHVLGVVDQASTVIGPGGVGSLEISGGGALNSDNSIVIGEGAGIGTVNQMGGSVTYGQWAAIGVGAGPPGSKWDISGGTIGGAGFEVGADRDGTMNVSGTASVIVPSATIGVRTGGDGKLNVMGGRFQTTGNFSVGGGQSAGLGTVEYTGGVLESGEFRLGITGGTGTINVRNGTFLQHGWGEVGSGVGATGNLNIIGPTASYMHAEGGGDLQVGFNGGTGNINVTGGGKMTTNWWLNMSRGAGSNSTVEVDGPGSRIDMDLTSTVAGGGPRLNIGEDGIGIMNLKDRAVVQVGAPFGAGGREVYVGRNGGSDGLLSVKSGAEIQANGSWALIVGQSGKGQVDVDTGGKVLSNNWIVIGNEAGSNGTVNIGDGGLIESGTPAGGAHEGRFITGRIGRALVNQAGGVARADNWFAIGIDSGGEGTYNLAGGKIELAMTNYGDRNIIVANNGIGTLNITHGTPAGNTIVSSRIDATFGDDINQFNVGGDSNGKGTLEINLNDPAGVIVHRELYVAWASGGSTASRGVVNILQGTLRTDGWVEIGRGQANSGGTGTVNVDGPNARWERGTLAPSNSGDRGVRDINIGQGENPNFGKGYLNVKNGGKVNHNWWINLARQPRSEGHITVDGPGSMINMVDAHLVGLGGDGNSQLNVGEGGTGTLDITNEGVFNHNMDHGGGEVWIARNDGSRGTTTVEGIGSQFNSKGREFRIGANNLGQGTLNIRDGGEVNFTSTRENGVKADGNFGLAENNDSLGEINMDGGTLNVAAWSLFSAWNSPLAEAKITMRNSTINIINDNPIDGGGNPTTGGHFFWGDAGTATINQEGGAINAQGWSAIGRERGGDSYYNLGVFGGGGVMTVGGGGGNELYVGRQSHGTITMGAGTSITVAGDMNLAQETSPTTPASGSVTNDGGTLMVGGEFNVGRNGPNTNMGTYTQTLGALNVTRDVFVGRDSTQGTINLAGGTASLSSNLNLGAGGGAGVVNVTGGRANAAGSLTVNTGSTLNASGNLNVNNGTPVGAGNLNVTGGLARIDGNAFVDGLVTVGAGGVLGGTGTVTAPSVTILTGGTVSPGGSPGTLTIDPALTLNAGSSYFVEITGITSNDKLVATTIIANGTIKVNLVGYVPVGGEIFDVANASISGLPTFDFTGANLSGGLLWDTSQFLVDGTLRVVLDPSDPYNAWAAGYGLTGGKTGDDDGDGDSNLLEFATNSNPTRGGSGARAFGRVVTLGGGQVLTLTVAVRNAAVFAANGSRQQATKDFVVYTVEATDNLTTWNTVVVTELNPADSAAVQAGLGLPALDAGWEYHTFRTDDTLALDYRDMIRLTVAVEP